jgi:hypothetical protein
MSPWFVFSETTKPPKAMTTEEGFFFCWLLLVDRRTYDSGDDQLAATINT